MRRSLLFAVILPLAAACAPEDAPSAPPAAEPSTAGPAYVIATRGADGTVTETAENGALDAAHQAGSHSKLVCAIAAVRLAEDGVLSLDDEVGMWVQGIDGPAAGITLRQLLQNRSGLPDAVVAAVQADPESLLARTDTAAIISAEFLDEPLGFAPGAAFDYVISNWVLVQAMLEAASGEALASLAERTVFEPARAEDAFIFSGELPGEGVPHAAEGGSMPVPGFIGCAGGLAATPADLIAILRSVYTTFDEVGTGTLTEVESPEEGYALGGRYYDIADRSGAMQPIAWMSGSNGDWESFSVYLPQSDTGMAVMTPTGERDAIAALRDEWVAAQGLSFGDDE